MRNRPIAGLLHIDLTAMIDVIFLLLIFWMMVARLSDEAHARVEEPVSDSAALERSAPQIWTVEIPDDATGRVWAAGRWVEVGELGALLADPGGAPAVLIRADARVDAARVQSVLSALAEAGARRVGLAVREPRP
jgi:biopolymer transport protein ExbD